MARCSIVVVLGSLLSVACSSAAGPSASESDGGTAGTSSGGVSASGSGSGGTSIDPTNEDAGGLTSATGSSGGSGAGGSSSGAGESSSGASGSSSGGGGGTASSSSGSSSGGTTTATPSLVIEPDQGLTPIYDLVSSATKTLDMTMYELVDTKVTSLLTGLAKSGVTVRVILDQNLEKSSNTTAYDALGAGGVQVHWANTTYAATHQKTITVDGATSAIMTLNLVSEDYSTTRDFAVITTDTADVAAIETTFGDDFANTSVTPPTGDDLVWSPTNSQTSMVDVINGATASLLVENEEMSDTAIVSALGSAASRGVNVEVVMTASSSWDSEFKTLSGDGVKIVTYASNASLYIHAKVILADYGTSAAKAFVGSENFSSASLTENRELGLVTSNAAILSGLNTTLTSDYGGGTAY